MWTQICGAAWGRRNTTQTEQPRVKRSFLCFCYARERQRDRMSICDRGRLRSWWGSQERCDVWCWYTWSDQWFVHAALYVLYIFIHKVYLTKKKTFCQRRNISMSAHYFTRSDSKSREYVSVILYAALNILYWRIISVSVSVCVRVCVNVWIFSTLV